MTFEQRMLEAGRRLGYLPTADQKMTDGYNILRSALAWFDSHEVEAKLGHLPQWVDDGRKLTNRS